MAFRSRLVRLAVFCFVIGLGLLAAGCGGGSGSSSASTSATTKSSAPAKAADGKEPSAEFLNKKDKSIVKWGKEASVAEREAASAVLAENFEAREAGDFAVQCETLTPSTIESIPGATETGNLKSNCAAALAKLASPLSKSAKARKNTLSGPIDAMRIQGNIGRALYHGNDGKDYAIGLEKENGNWKVGSIETIEL